MRRSSACLLCVLLLAQSLARSLEQPRYDTAYACEGKTLHIACADGELIHLIRANYGRFSITICNDHGNTEWSVNCMSPKSLRVLHNRCSHQQNCSILATTNVFGDPCQGTLKYLEAHYQCMPAATTTTTSRPSPPWLTTSQPSVWSTAKPVILRLPSTPESPITTSTTTTSTPGPTSPPVVTTSTPSPSTWPPAPVQDEQTGQPVTTAPTTTSSPAKTVSTSIFEYIPSPSAPWFHENELVQLCTPTMARNLYWNWTWAGDTSEQPCPGGATGRARWKCAHQPHGPPKWSPETPDLADCHTLWFTNLETRIEHGDSITSIANELSQVTGGVTLYGGDMVTTTKIVKKMAQKMSLDIQTFPDPRQREAIVTELLFGVVRTGSNLLDSSQHPSWKDLSYAEQMRVTTSLLMGLEENAFLLADTVIREKTVVQSVKNILLSVRVLDTRNLVPVEQFPSAATLQQWSVSQDKLYIPQKALRENSEGGLVRLVLAAFDRLDEILQPPRTANRTRLLNSKIISASLGKGKHIQLSEPVKLSLKHLVTENVTNPSCVFWDYINSAWSDEGCRVEETNDTHTTCSCDHLTNFAVLMDVHATYLKPAHQATLEVVTYVGCIISVVCLVLAIITFQLFRGLKSDRTTIHKNLCVCLLIAEVLFLAGIGQTEQRIICGVVAGLLHFFFLCAFAWMFLEGFQLYVMLIEVFEAEKSRMRWYYIFAYGAPLIIVAVSCSVDHLSYGTDKYCWLRADNFFIFSFVGPVIAVILANLVFLSMAIYMMCRHSNASTSMKSKEHSRLASTRAWLRGAIILVFLLGLTWTFGLLYLNEASVIMAYIFTVLNSLQGMFIFLFHCVQNEKVRKEYKKFIRRQSWLPKCLRCSKHSNGSKERRTSVYAGNPSTDSSALSPHGTSYLVPRECTSRGKCSLAVPSRHDVRASTSSREVEVCVSTLPYRHPHTSNLSKSASTWGSLHKPLMWKNISFKSYSRDSGHGGSEQEESPRSHTTTLNSLNNLRSKEIRRPLGESAIMVGVEEVPRLTRNRPMTGGQPRPPSPWNHTYTEIRDDPVYEEIERGGEMQVSDMSDEDGKRQSDVSRQSSRSYGDHRPLIPYSPGCDLPTSRLRNARTVAVLDGETVVCHLQPDHSLYPYSPRTAVLPPYSEC